MEAFFAQWDLDIEDPSKDRSQVYHSIIDKQHKTHESDNVEVLWRCVRACLMMADLSEKTGDAAQKKHYTERAVDFAKQAVKCAPNSVQAHKWYCAAVGQMSSLVGTKERIKLGYEFKEHRDLAVAIDPDDRLMNYMYGRWCYEIASLSTFERTMASAFFATPPSATYDDALESLLRADKQLHEWKACQLWLGKVYAAQKHYHSAIKCIDFGLELPCKTEDDEIAQIELKKLEKTYAKYR